MGNGTNWESAIAYLGEERTPESEQRVFEEMIRDVQDVVRNCAAANGRPMRAQHAKKLVGIGHARFRVMDSIPEDLRVGFIRPGNEFRAQVRFSNAGGFERPNDARPHDLRGVAIRVQCGNEEGASDHDFLMTNAEPHHARDAVQAMAISLAFSDESELLRAIGTRGEEILDRFDTSGSAGDLLGRAADALRLAVAQVEGLGTLIRKLGLKETRRMVFKVLKPQVSEPVESLATETYWSRAPIAIGAAAAAGGVAVKYRLKPTVKKGRPESSHPNLREEFVSRLGSEEVRFHFEVQRFADAVTTPIEDATVHWPTNFETIAELVIPRQSLEEDGENAVDSLRFNPWNVHSDAFLPLGNMNRARRLVYEASVRMRTAASS